MTFEAPFYKQRHTFAPGWYKWPVQPLALWESHAVYLWWDGMSWSDHVYTRSGICALARHRSVITTEAVAVGVLGGIFAGIVLLLDVYLVLNMLLGGAGTVGEYVIWVLLSIGGYLIGGFALYNGLRARQHLRSFLR